MTADPDHLATDRRFLAVAIEQARIGRDEGGVPIGGALVADGTVLGAGHNRRVQLGSAIRHGESTAPWFGDTYSDVHNLTGWPAVVVRGGSSPEGLPIGVQVVSPPWREDLALAAAQVVESVSGGWQPPPR